MSLFCPVWAIWVYIGLQPVIYFCLFETVCWFCYNYSFGQISSVIRKQLENGTLRCNQLIRVTLPSSDATRLTNLFLCSTQLHFSKISDSECKLKVVPEHGCCYDSHSKPINARVFPLSKKSSRFSYFLTLHKSFCCFCSDVKKVRD